MKLQVAAIVLTIGLASAIPIFEKQNVFTFSEEIYTAEFEKFVQTFEKKFETEAQKLYRFAVFVKNFDYIHTFNKESESVRLAVNQFADLTKEEFFKMYTGFNAEIKEVEQALHIHTALDNATLPDSVDWVAKGAVTPVKNQQQCGSCWAFSTTGAVEGAVFVGKNVLESLSEQELVDCDQTDNGCSGGLMDNGFNFAQKNGLTLEKTYAYKAAVGTCDTKKENDAAPSTKISGHVDVNRNDEAALKSAVAKQPVSVAIEADKRVFQFYSSGVLDSKDCGTQLDHGVLAVGYGTDSTGKKYWKVKNSWGPSWGQQGYILLARTDSSSSEGMCGIAKMASYPTV